VEDRSDQDPLSAWSRDRLIAEIESLRSRSGSSPEGRGSGPEVGVGPDELTTVSVPEALVPQFLKAQRYVASFFESFVHRPQEATISIAGDRYILLRAASLSVEFVDLVVSLYRDQGEDEARAVARNLLFDLAHALGKADALSFHRKMNVEDPLDRLSAGPVHFAFSGWAFVDISPESHPSPDEDFLLLYDHPFSFESESWRAKGRRSEEPVCIMNAGYSSGWCEECFDVPLVAVETECVAAGGDHCRFLMAPPSRIEQHLKDRGLGPGAGRAAGAASISVPEFFQRKRLEDDLRQANQTLEDRVAERTAELQAASSRLGLLATAVENATEGIVILRRTDDAGDLSIELANEGFCAMVDRPRDEVLGRSLEILDVRSEDRGSMLALRRAVEEGHAFQGEVSVSRGDGSEFALELHIMPASAVDEQHRHWIGILRDVTERKRQVAELRHQALYDNLTDLPNRALLYDRVEQAIRVALREKHLSSLMIMDLDGFKEINDTFGHPVGDELLRQVGPRLEGALRESDTVARLGGDEFAVVLPKIRDRDDAVAVARTLLAAVQEPFAVETQQLVVGASIGIVFCPEHGRDAASLLRRADIAMYAAKYAHRGVEIYEEELDSHSPDRLAMVGELRHGISRGELVLHYQPIERLTGGQVRRVEALVRWDHPSRGLLAPAEFLPLVEPGNMAEIFTMAIVRSVVEDLQRILSLGHDLGVSVNLSPKVLRSGRLYGFLNECLEQRPSLRSRLTLEVTEGGLLEDPEYLRPRFEALVRSGYRLSIDDFGTGGASLTHLRQLPFDEIKIDRSFVLGMLDHDHDAAIVRSTIDLGRSLGRTVVAEGIEDAATREALTRLGCDYGQGYLLSRPLPVDELVEWLGG
jgi:diguanylate cyclase (GGDEF)-like protein/PAS domain S-box-containing protein